MRLNKALFKTRDLVRWVLYYHARSYVIRTSYPWGLNKGICRLSRYRTVQYGIVDYGKEQLRLCHPYYISRCWTLHKNATFAIDDIEMFWLGNFFDHNGLDWICKICGEIVNHKKGHSSKKLYEKMLGITTQWPDAHKVWGASIHNCKSRRQK